MWRRLAVGGPGAAQCRESVQEEHEIMRCSPRPVPLAGRLGSLAAASLLGVAVIVSAPAAARSAGSGGRAPSFALAPVPQRFFRATLRMQAWRRCVPCWLTTA